MVYFKDSSYLDSVGTKLDKVVKAHETRQVNSLHSISFAHSPWSIQIASTAPFFTLALLVL